MNGGPTLNLIINQLVKDNETTVATSSPVRAVRMWVDLRRPAANIRKEDASPIRISSTLPRKLLIELVAAVGLEPTTYGL